MGTVHNLYNLDQLKDPLNEYLESFTSKDAKAIVDACGEHNALDAWRQLAEHGFSLRPTHINALMKSALWPRAAVPLKDLEMAIAMWETDVHVYEAATSDKVPLAQRKVNLEEMCPESRRKHLKLLGPEKLASYEAMRAEIAEWVANEVRKPMRPRAAALEQSAHSHGDGSGEMDFESMDADRLWKVILETASEEMNPNQLSVLVMNLKVKKGKGKGKGPRKCYECNSEEHIGKDCPVRAQRIANGGPERLLKDADKVIGVLGGKPIGKGCAKGAGKDGRRFRAKADWKAFNPDPNLIRPSQWGHWHPANQQQQLRSFTEDGGWLATLGAMLSGAFRTRTETRRQVLQKKEGDRENKSAEQVRGTAGARRIAREGRRCG